MAWRVREYWETCDRLYWVVVVVALLVISASLLLSGCISIPSMGVKRVSGGVYSGSVEMADPPADEGELEVKIRAGARAGATVQGWVGGAPVPTIKQSTSP